MLWYAHNYFLQYIIFIFVPRWKLVVHGGIDGYSQMIVLLMLC